MGRIILGVIVGFIVWSILWVGSSEILMVASTDYAKSMETMNFSSGMLIFSLIRSFICSIAAGFVAVLLAKEFFKTTLGLGILLLVFGIFVQIGVWDKIPVWYHLIFLALLIPLTMLGGNLKKQEPLA
jgi:hypothetical protein